MGLVLELPEGTRVPPSPQRRAARRTYRNRSYCWFSALAAAETRAPLSSWDLLSKNVDQRSLFSSGRTEAE